MRFRVAYVSTDPITMLYVHERDSYSAFKTAVSLMDEGTAHECIVYIADGNEWVKLANVRKEEN